MKGKKQMRHKPYCQLFAACFVVFALGLSTIQASFIELEPNGSGGGVVLADLLNGNVEGISVGDKTFSEFFYSTLPDDDMPAAEDINVFGFLDVDGNYGISFQGAFIDLPGGGSSDALLRFTVDVSPEAAEEGFRISGANLFIGGFGVGEDSVFAVDESFQQNNASLNAYTTTLGDSQDTQASDWVFFEENYTSLRVTKDIFALASNDSNLPARATVIDQSFSQVLIPEPATISLVVLALLGGLAVGKRD